MSVQPPTPWAQPSAPARWLWHVRTHGWRDLRGQRCCPTGTEHIPGAGDCLLGLLGAGSGRRDACLGTAANTVKQPWSWGLSRAEHWIPALHIPTWGFQGFSGCCCTGISLCVRAHIPFCWPGTQPAYSVSPGRASRAARHPGDRPEVQEHGAGAMEARREQSPLHLHAGAQAGGYVASETWPPPLCLGAPLAGLQRSPLHGWVLEAWESGTGCSRNLIMSPCRQGSMSGSWSALASLTATST